MAAARYAVIDGELDELRDTDEDVKALYDYIVKHDNEPMSGMGWDGYLAGIVILAEKAHDALRGEESEDLPDAD